MAKPNRPPASVQAKLAAAAKLREEAARLAAEARALQRDAARAASTLRPRGLVPAGFQWRDGRPRWFAHDKLRAAGWKGLDLKDPSGAWLAKGDAIARAEQIILAVAAWKAGEAAPLEFEAIAPKSATEGGAAPSRLDPRSIGALLDAHLGVPAATKEGQKKGEWLIPASREFLALKNGADRRSKLSRFVDVLAGYAIKPGRDAPAKEMAAYHNARAKVRSRSIYTLEPPPFDPRQVGQVEDDLLSFAYGIMLDKVGHNMAHGVLTEVSAWLEWCVKRKRAIPLNWAKSVERSAPDGRIRVGDWDELAALIAAAEAMGYASIADSIILGVDLSWSQADRLHMTWPQIKDGRVTTNRRKTGNRGATPLLTSLGLPRLQQIRERQAQLFGPSVTPTHVLICEDTNQPWKPAWYRHRFADVRAKAQQMLLEAANAPDLAPERCARLNAASETILDLRDQDLRDTAVTVAYDAGLDLQEIASRTLHSMKRIQDVLEKHYGEISQHVADKGARKLEAYLAEKGVRL